MNAPAITPDTAPSDAKPVFVPGRADLDIIAKGYHFIVGHQGVILALTAGDHHYEDTGIVADPGNWRITDDFEKEEHNDFGGPAQLDTIAAAQSFVIDDAGQLQAVLVDGQQADTGITCQMWSWTRDPA